MDPWEDPYEILEVDDDADVDEIKEAYRRRAEETNPDAQGGDEEAFSRVQEAYERLMEMSTPVEDAERRHEPGMQQEKHTIVDELRLGWEMYRTPDWEFYIVRYAREPEDAAEEETGSTDPRMKDEIGEMEEKPAEPPTPDEDPGDDGEEEDDVEVEYVDGQGSAVPEPYYFDDSDEARKAFARHLKHRKIERESEDDEEIEAEDRGWGSSILGRKLGRRWTLTHQEREPLGERTRWAVYSEGSDSYIDEEGLESESEQWFETESKAVDAHERYVGEREVPDTLPAYLVFLLVYFVFLLPYHLVLGGVGAVYRVNGGGRDDRYVAEAVVVVALALLSFLVSPWIAGYLLVQVAVVAVYWASPYDVEALGPVPPLRRS